MSGVPNPNPDRARRAQATTLQAMLGLQPATTALALAAAPSPAVMADKLVLEGGPDTVRYVFYDCIRLHFRYSGYVLYK